MAKASVVTQSGKEATGEVVRRDDRPMRPVECAMYGIDDDGTRIRTTVQDVSGYRWTGIQK